MNTVLRVVAIVFVLLTLSACERSRFVVAPADATGCNPTLIGHWSSVASDGGDAGEMQATVDAQCQLQITEADKKPARVSPPTRLRSASVGELQLLWVDARWADQAFAIESDAITPSTEQVSNDIYLFAWQRDANRLSLRAPDHRALARAGIDKAIKADVLRLEYSLHVRVREPQVDLQRLLAAGQVFTDDSQTVAFDQVSGTEP